jgi:hypothetical protein
MGGICMGDMRNIESLLGRDQSGNLGLDGRRNGV